MFPQEFQREASFGRLRQQQKEKMTKNLREMEAGETVVGKAALK